jgi:hypothetical protein
MSRIEKWLRNSMEEERFNYLSILSIKRDISNLIDIQGIVDRFSKMNRRITLI